MTASDAATPRPPIHPALVSPDHLFPVVEGPGPVVALAVHAGHEIRADLLAYCLLSEAERLREEDPFTEVLAEACPTRLVARRSRFEADLNRTRASALCETPEECWGLRVWREEAAPGLVAIAQAEHDAFYARLADLLRRIEARHGRFVVFDLHSYNHRRDGPDAPPAPAEDNPEINLGTGTMDRAYWAPVVERFLAEMRAVRIAGAALDVRENVKFEGREVARFVHEGFPETGCVLAIEAKKTFVDEWTGALDLARLLALREALGRAAAGVAQALGEVGR
ncbi:N-formylglutamate amidohydrolase [Salinarimonas sp.]|uniref:N-formylglutamate amidohydrolase n=1 Tax=Salinarimonas sp. TaxID=2766526 RepID=UPI0032D8C098